MEMAGRMPGARRQMPDSRRKDAKMYIKLMGRGLSLLLFSLWHGDETLAGANCQRPGTNSTFRV